MTPNNTPKTCPDITTPRLNRFVAGLLLAVMASSSSATGEHALEHYVSRPDPAFSWSPYHEYKSWLAHFHFLQLTSQQWLDAEQVDRSLWTHELRLVIPRGPLCGRLRAGSTTAVLVITGGRNRPNAVPGTRIPEMAMMIARSFCRPVVQLRQVPNQPLRLAGEPARQTEDALITASFARYLQGEPGDWPVHKAMVKSVVQAMNAIEAFSRERDDVPAIDGFVLLGASKRGWTAWLTAAVDPRVRAIIPVSIDMPNLPRQFEHHLRAYGGYARALRDYEAHDIGCHFDSERGRALLELVDPHAYRERLTMPKFVINAAGDEFFVPDAWRFYLDDLPGQTSLRYTVNTGHDQGSAREQWALFQAAASWVDAVLDGQVPPTVRWAVDNGTLVVETSEAARQVKLWYADNPVARDFRIETLGPVWQSRELTPDDDGRYRVALTSPESGWRAALVEASFGGWRLRDRQVYTTGVYVTPERMPYPPPECPESFRHQ